MDSQIGIYRLVIPGLTEHRHPRLDRGSKQYNSEEGYGEERIYIYFMTNRNNSVLYTGITNSLKRRIQEHSEGRGSAFTHKYNCNKLVYFEVLPTIEQAIAREKQIKHYKREWKNELVDLMNPNWDDLTGNIIIDPDIV